MENIYNIVTAANEFSNHHLLNIKHVLFGVLKNNVSIINYILDRTAKRDLIFMEIGFDMERKMFGIGLVIQDTCISNEDGHVLIFEYEFKGQDNPDGWACAELVSLMVEGVMSVIGVNIQDMSQEVNESTLRAINNMGVTVMSSGY